MHVALWDLDTMGAMPQDLTGSGAFEIGEDDLVLAQPKVRALQVQRLEQLWDMVRGRLDEAEQGAVAHDPRFLEIGIRILKEEALIYRLAKPAPPLEEEEDPEVVGVNRLALINAQLDELEAKKQATADKEQAVRDKDSGTQ